ncbi:MAG: hypothetical protein ACLU98_06750 [Desulfovibrio fairfieldensis]
MPTIRKDRDNAWMARVTINGLQVASQMFTPGRRKGPEWTAAKSWEVKTKADILALLEQGLTLPRALQQLDLKPNLQLENENPEPQTPTGLERLLAWGDAYLAHVMRTMTHQTYVEQTVLRAFCRYCGEEGILSPERSPGRWPTSSGRCRRRTVEQPGQCVQENLLAAWNWGMDFGTVSRAPLFRAYPPFPVDRGCGTCLKKTLWPF